MGPRALDLLGNLQSNHLYPQVTTVKDAHLIPPLRPHKVKQKLL